MTVISSYLQEAVHGVALIFETGLDNFVLSVDKLRSSVALMAFYSVAKPDLCCQLFIHSFTYIVRTRQNDKRCTHKRINTRKRSSMFRGCVRTRGRTVQRPNRTP